MFQLLKRSAAGVSNAAAGKVKLFFDTDGLAKTKDENGVLSTLGGVFSFNGRVGNITPQQADYSSFFQKLHWIDVTTVGISPANTAAQNTTAWNTFYSTVPVNSTVYFPAGTYDFSGELTLNRNVQIRIVGDGKSRTILRTTSATANLFYISISAYYYSFEELGFNSTVTKTAGAFIGTNPAAGDNAYLDIRRCEFKGYFIGVALDGVGSANVGTISECIWNSPSAGGTGLRINGANINNMITNCTINQNPGSTGTGVCVEINQSGAVQFVGCDFIGGANTLRVNPGAGQVVSALYFTNCFFDQAGSKCVQFTGAGAVSRVKFVSCGITNGNVTNSFALAVEGTGTGTNIPEALDFLECDFYNAFGTGITTTGISITGARGVSFVGCRISGFTVGIDLTPYNSNGVTSFNIVRCTVGPTENFPGNVTGIRINAGAFQYGSSSITDCDLQGNTTPLINNATFGANDSLYLNGNNGILQRPIGQAPNLLLATAATAVRAGVAVPVRTNSIRPGSAIRIRAMCTNAATASTNTITLRLGTANTNADTAIVTLALGAGTAAVGGAVIEATIYFQSTTSATASVIVYNNGAAGFTNAAVTVSNSTANVAITNTADQYLGLYVSPSAANVVTIRNVVYEELSQ
jgi:hypothetical protein